MSCIIKLGGLVLLHRGQSKEYEVDARERIELKKHIFNLYANRINVKVLNENIHV